MIILAIETSCDEASIAIIENGKVLHIKTISQIPIHREFGGVVPEVASRNHTMAILPLISETLKEKYPNLDFVDAIAKMDALAVTTGPGLIGSLLVGVNTAKTIGYLANKLVYPVNHLEGHIYSAWIEQPVTSNRSLIHFPALVLIVSGGHTELVEMQKHGKYNILGQTLDDACGEAFDKVAKLLNLPYPGGPEIEKRARKGNLKTYRLPIPMQKNDSLNFSFSGLKTSVLYLTKKTKNIQVDDLCASFQNSVIESLIDKTTKAIRKVKPKYLLISGGVANNQALRNAFEKKLEQRFPNLKIAFPPRALCTDNAAMIGVAAYFQSLEKAGKNWYDVDINPNAKLTNEQKSP